MTLTAAFLSCAAVFALLHFVLLPAARAAWSTADLLPKIPRVMLVGVLEKLAQLSGVACLTFGILALFVVIAGAGSPRTSESALHLLRRVQSLDRPSKEIEEWYKGWIFLWSLLLFSFLWYRTTRSFALKKIGKIRMMEYKRLAELRDKSPEEWAELKPTSEMVKLEENIQSLLAYAKLASDQNGPRERIVALVQQAEHLSQIRMILDFDRRIEIPWDLPNLSNDPPRSALARLLTSKGFLSDITWPGKILSIACTVLVLIATAGACMPKVDQEFQERLAHLRDIEIELESKESAHKLDQADAHLQAPVPIEPPSESANSAAVQRFSSRVARSISSNEELPNLSRELRQEVARTLILEKTGLISKDSNHADGSSGAELLNGVINSDPSNWPMTKYISTEITQREKADPRIGPRILAWAARHNEPADAVTLADHMTQQLADALFTTVPTGDNPLAGEAIDQLSDPIKEQAGTEIKSAMNRIYASLLSDQDPERTLAQINDRRVFDLLLTGADQERFRAAFPDADRQHQWATDISRMRLQSSSLESGQDTSSIRVELNELPIELDERREVELSYLTRTYSSEFPLSIGSFISDETLKDLTSKTRSTVPPESLDARVERAVSFEGQRNYSRTGGILIWPSVYWTFEIMFFTNTLDANGKANLPQTCRVQREPNKPGQLSRLFSEPRTGLCSRFEADSCNYAQRRNDGQRASANPSCAGGYPIGPWFLRADEWIFDALDSPQLTREIKTMQAERDVYARTLAVINPGASNSERVSDIAEIRGNLNDSTADLLSRSKAFDSHVMHIGLSCANASQSDDQFDWCVNRDKGSVQSADLHAPVVAFVSQIYEAEFPIDDQKNFVDSLQSSEGLLNPLQFTIQMTINNNEHLTLPEFSNGNEASSTGAVISYINSKGEGYLLDQLRSFAMLQRVFRGALDGALGPDFDLDSMVLLLDRSNGESIHCSTPRWKQMENQGRQTLERELGENLRTISQTTYSSTADPKESAMELSALVRCSASLLQDGSYRLPASSIKALCQSSRTFKDWSSDCQAMLRRGKGSRSVQACGFASAVYVMELAYSSHRLREAAAVDAPIRGSSSLCPKGN